MSTVESDPSITMVGRKQFLELLERQLRYRWHGDPSIVNEAIADLFGSHRQQQMRLVKDLVAHHANRASTYQPPLALFLKRHRSIRELFRQRKKIALPSQAVEGRSDAAYRWPVPVISNEGQLASWLGLTSPAVLDWLALPHCRRSAPVEHYQRVSHRKRDGTIRWIEQPRPVMRRVQGTIKRELVDRIPLHRAAHGFRKGHDVASCARPHVGKEVLMRMDLQDFFGSIRTWRIRSLMMVAGYPEPVAACLARLCTAAPLAGTDDAILRHSRLPQGAPSSPGLANVAAFRLDRRLTALSESAGACYTRYADDLIFSGGESLARRSKRFATSAAAIAMDEGFKVNFRKTAMMRRGGRQQVLGLVVNERVSTPRQHYETIKAIVTNCVRHGPSSQNREQHPQFRESLRGRIAHIAATHASRGEKLQRLFQQIDWNE